MNRRLTQIFLQRRHTDGKLAHEKMLNVANYYRNANQNYNEASLHSGQNAHHQKVYKQQMLEGCGVKKKKPFLHCWWEYKLAQPLWRTVWRVLKKLTMELPYDPAILFLGMYLKKIYFINFNFKRYMYSNVPSSNIYNSQDMEAT